MSKCRSCGISLIVVNSSKVEMSPMFGTPPDSVNSVIPVAAFEPLREVSRVHASSRSAD
jgi:hypothetical protein